MASEPFPKSKQLARGAKRYRRKVASPRQWQAIIAAKIGPCRVCCDPGTNGSQFGRIQLHHIVSRGELGDDVPDNLVPVCRDCHHRITTRDATACRSLLESLTDAEYSYAGGKCGEGWAERIYGVTFSQPGSGA